ncbi:unnamed protein product [Caenorhabditis auriculariae]|uniref:5' exonuclease Apollo n=1 Tax=Caenorhabditis auriculariae TaxID=2777116 RepID=A0A8S1HVW8_9PELO|nr:unnamed protein product [Caenorhabditis auriculariae]
MAGSPLKLDDRLAYAAKYDSKKLYSYLRRYFDIIGQVHSVIHTKQGSVFVRLWNGTVPAKNATRTVITKLFRVEDCVIGKHISPPLLAISEATERLGEGAIYDISVYEEYIKPAEALKSGDYVVISNIHYYSQISQPADCLTIHARGQFYNRGVVKIPSDCQNQHYLEVKQRIESLISQNVHHKDLNETAEVKERSDVENQPNPPRFETNYEEQPNPVDQANIVKIVSTTVENEIFIEEDDQCFEDIPRHKAILIGENFISVDLLGKRDGCSYHFLTHAHSDHCSGVNIGWTTPIHCSKATSKLLPILTMSKKKKGVDPAYLQALEVGKTHKMKGFEVTVLEANHCIGAVMFLFQGPLIPGGAVLCTGDFRADDMLIRRFGADPSFDLLAETHLSAVYLDNTYLDDSPTDHFITREEAVGVLLKEIRKYPYHKIILPMHKLGREDLLELLHDKLGEPISLYDIRENCATKLELHMMIDERRKSPRKSIDNKKTAIEEPRIRVVQRNSAAIRKELSREDKEFIIFDITMKTGTLPLSEEELKSTYHIGYSDHSSKSEILNFMQHLSFDAVFPISAPMSPFSKQELMELNRNLPSLNKTTKINVQKKQKTMTEVVTISLENEDPEEDVRIEEDTENRSTVEREQVQPVDSGNSDYLSNKEVMEVSQRLSRRIEDVYKEIRLEPQPVQCLPAARLSGYEGSLQGFRQPQSLREAIAFIFAPDPVKPAISNGFDMNIVAPPPFIEPESANDSYNSEPLFSTDNEPQASRRFRGKMRRELPFILVFLNCFVLLISAIQEDEIAKSFVLNETTFAAYNSSDSPCRIECADAETMASASFDDFQKIWMVNDSDSFDANTMIFINGNRSLEFAVLNAEDSGSYKCCVRALDLAYQSFVCYFTQITVIEDLPAELNSTEAPLPPAWNFQVPEGGFLNGQQEHTYFLRLFEESNLTDIACTVNGIIGHVKTNNAFPFPTNNDMLIRDFNTTLHTGVYVCNGTIQAGNETETASTTFTVRESLEQNEGAVMLDDAFVHKVLAQADEDSSAANRAFLALSFIFLMLQ